ncbi:MAG TPA: SgcJ/EcaC family oxidoreductase [Geminicoccaceae bacterium]|nr:SgcJ/EcaC family oxidoreductase [Geminicoccaceae bacterium]
MSANPADLRAVVAGNNQKWNDAFNSGNVDAVAALYTRDATVLPHTHDVITGAENIRSFWKAVVDGGFRDHTIEVIDVYGKGDVAYQTARWTATGAGEGGGRRSFGGSLVTVSERQDDGSWKLRLHIWN